MGDTREVCKFFTGTGCRFGSNCWKAHPAPLSEGYQGQVRPAIDVNNNGAPISFRQIQDNHAELAYAKFMRQKHILTTDAYQYPANDVKNEGFYLEDQTHNKDHENTSTSTMHHFDSLQLVRPGPAASSSDAQGRNQPRTQQLNISSIHIDQFTPGSLLAEQLICADPNAPLFLKNHDNVFQSTCRYWYSATCNRGLACRFAHPIPNERDFPISRFLAAGHGSVSTDAGPIHSSMVTTDAKEYLAAGPTELAVLSGLMNNEIGCQLYHDNG